MSILAKKSESQDSLIEYLRSPQIMRAMKKVASQQTTPDRLVNIAAMMVKSVPALADCTKLSLVTSLLRVSELGLHLSPSLGQVYLVPYKTECTLIVGYKGLIALAMRNQDVESVIAYPVFEGEVFEHRLGTEPYVRHERVPDADESKLMWVYAMVRLRSGFTMVDVMSKREIDKVRARSRSGSGPWSTDYVEMARKTVVRRLLKYAPVSVDLAKGLSLDNEDDNNTGSKLSEFDSDSVIETEFSDIAQPEPPASKGVEAVSAKIPPAEDARAILAVAGWDSVSIDEWIDAKKHLKPHMQVAAAKEAVKP